MYADYYEPAIRDNGTKKKRIESAIIERTKTIGSDYVSQTDALIRFFFKEDPDKMDEEKYISVAGQLWWALDKTGSVKIEGGKITFIK